MSLDFRVTKIENYEDNFPRKEIETWDVKGDKVVQYEWHPVTQSIVFGCITTGIGELRNEKDAVEWWSRYNAWCRLRGFDNNLTIEHLVKHIGLTTNVFPRETELQWIKKIVTPTLRDGRRQAESKLAQAKEAAK